VVAWTHFLSHRVDGPISCLTGKTTFIKHLLGREYPGINIGPEPTTDRFVVVMDGMEERRTPGNTLIVSPDKPFQVGLPFLLVEQPRRWFGPHSLSLQRIVPSFLSFLRGR